ncbi:hypothetical protein FE257_010910 [Aspergillus nanangensis]|uniref:Uncharacterized protein n=1 Tax=Aspergillus nanangensis TaxID=2582783 RepID=A0AAD4CXH3_ASPNN|nr:hypothetical protein FE257_010910 [Aspergillus nanangensis]
MRQSAPCNGYTPPNTGVFALMPSSWIPYAELMRLDRASGFYAFYWHYMIGLAFAACIANPMPSPSAIMALAVHLAVWVVILRGAACTWNDNLDQDFDRKVTRTRYRPIARGTVSTMQGHLFALIQVALGVVLLIPMPDGCGGHAAAIMATLAIYPLGKRFTHFPQVILGVGFSLAILMACAALDVELYTRLGSNGDSDDLLPQTMATMCLFAACLLWTVIFDTVYAHQDVDDDVKAGVRSLAVLLGGHSRAGLLVMALAQCVFLVMVGIMCDFSAIYFMASCGGTLVTLMTMVRTVDLKRPESCAWWFGPGSKIVGVAIVGGLLGEYWVRRQLVGVGSLYM